MATQWSRPAPVVEEPALYAHISYAFSDRPTLISVLVELHGDMCYYCQNEFVDTENAKRSRTVDHYHSQDFCKKNDYTFEQIHGISNLVLACKSCNAIKSNRQWTQDNTLEPKIQVKMPKAARPEYCEHCYSGRLLLIGEKCDICGSVPQPRSAPSTYQLRPKECPHDGPWHCWQCYIGHVPRVSPLNFTKENV